MLRRLLVAVLWTYALDVSALDNGVGLTPAMGYNTWDDFRCGGINASNVEKVANAMVAHGLQAVGYNYVNIDDCWAVARDNKTGVIVADPKAFPKGMKALADYVHNLNFKFGIYTDRGTATCVGRPGSQGYEVIDAQTYAKWGVDFVKEDSCSAPTDHNNSYGQYAKMRDALNATGRPILFALCGWSSWYAQYGQELGNSWRVGYDVNTWSGIYGNAISVNSKLAQYAGPGGFNDVDALIGSSPHAAVSVTQTQSRTQFSMWAVMAAPLIIGSNVLHITPFDLETYKNTEVIAIDQDTLGLQGELVWEACANADTVSSLLGLPSRPFKDEDYLYPRSGGGGGGSGGGRKEQQQLPDLGSHRQVGSKGNASPPVPPCQHIWLKKLVDGYALAFVNYTYINATIKNGHNVVHGQGDGDVDGGGGDEGVAAAMAPKPFLHAEGGDQTSSHGELALVACNASDPAQLWNLTVDGTATTIKISVDTEGPLKSPACWEIDACNYNAGASVDTKYGCRPVPKPGDKVPCDSNMAWQLHKNGTITSIYSGLCFELEGGGTLAACDGSKRQQWTVQGSQGHQTIRAAGNKYSCISNGNPTEPVGKMVFDVPSMIGWPKAHVRDVWAHKDMGAMASIAVSLAAGNGTSMLFKLTKA